MEDKIDSIGLTPTEQSPEPQHDLGVQVAPKIGSKLVLL